MVVTARQQVQNRLDTPDLRAGGDFGGSASIPGASGAQGVNVIAPDTSVLNSIAQWGGSVIREKAEKQYNKDLLEGKMAHMQGRAFEEVQTTGNKWMIEGYQVMEAQTISSTLLASQLADIDYSSYADDPEAFRAAYMGQTDALLDGKDPRVQELVKDQLTQQMPALVERHMGANLAYKQERNYTSAVNAIAVVSNDSTADAEFDRLTNPDGPMASLGPREYNAAITDGVVAAFNDMNPKAFVKLQQLGRIDGLDIDQKSKIDGAKKQYMQRLRSEGNRDRIEAHEEFFTKLEDGDFENAISAVDAWTQMEAKYGITDVTYEEGMRIVGAAREGIDVRNASTGLAVQEAMLQGDFTSAAGLVKGALGYMESGNRYDITGTTGKGGSKVYGKYQVLDVNVGPWTEKWYGTRLTPEQLLKNPAAQEAVFEGEFGSYLARTGSVEDAITMWHAGPGMSYAKAKASGIGDKNMKTVDYVDKIMRNLGQTPKGRMVEAQARVDALKNSKEGHEYFQFKFAQDKNNQAYASGAMDRGEWLIKNDALMSKFNQTMDRGMVDSLMEFDKKVSSSIDNPEVAASYNAAHSEIAELEGRMQAVINNQDVPPEVQNAAITEYLSARKSILQNSGLPRSMWMEQQNMASIPGYFKNAVETQNKAAMRAADVEAAANTGMLGTAPGLDRRATKKWWDNESAKIKQDANRIAASNPGMSQDDADTYVQQETLKLMSRSGYVPAEMKQAYSGMLGGPLLDKNGNPEQIAVDAVLDYNTLKTMNPAMADSLLDPRAKAVAESILDMAGNDPRRVAYMMQRREMAKHLPAGFPTPEAFVSSPEGQSAIDAAVSSRLDPGFFAWVGNGFNEPSSYTAKTGDPVFREGMRQAIEDQVALDYVLTGGQGDINHLVKSATTTVLDRTAVLGGVPFVSNIPGLKPTMEAFGAYQAPSGTDGINSVASNFANSMSSDESSLDSAMKLWMYNRRGQEGVPANLGGLPAFSVSAGLAAMGDRSTYNNMVMDNIEYSPHYYEQTKDGAVLHATAILSDGSTYPMVIPLRQAGQEYIKYKTGRAIDGYNN